MATNEEMLMSDDVDEVIQEVLEKWDDQQVVEPKDIPSVDVNRDTEEAAREFEASVLRGRAVYLSRGAGCILCHGKRADGYVPEGAVSSSASAPKKVDDWGFPSKPRNLTLGLFAGGRRPIDLYCRITQGINGTPMPQNKALPPEQVWDLVNFLRALPNRPGLLADEPKTVPLPTEAAGENKPAPVNTTDKKDESAK